jgi:uncharacterized membrane protein
MTEKQEWRRAVADDRSRGRRPLYGGLTALAVGLAHFVRPGIFEPITRLGFPERPRTFTYINGAVETLIGVLIAVPQFRRASIVVTLCYGLHFSGNVIRSRARASRCSRY